MRCEAPAARGVASEATSHLLPLCLCERGVMYMVVTGKGVFISNTEEKAMDSMVTSMSQAEGPFPAPENDMIWKSLQLTSVKMRLLE